MKPSPNNGSLRSIFTRTAIILIVLTGLITIGFEVMSFRNGSNVARKQFYLNQKKQLDLLESELNSELRQLVQIFPAFVKSQELLTRITEATLVGPYFVYSPQLYGQPIDYWDRVQILKRQIWIVNYFLPLLHSKQLDHLGVYLFDPHNNLIRNSLVPFIELEHPSVSFYSYPTKGLFHQLRKHSQSEVEKIALSDEYFDQIIYNNGERGTLYSALGFRETIIPINGISDDRFNHSDKIRVDSLEREIILERSITLEAKIYNWKTQKRELTAVAALIAQKKIDREYLIRIQQKFGSDDLAMISEFQKPISTIKLQNQVLEKEQGKIRSGLKTYHYQSRPINSPMLESVIRLYIFTDQDQIERNPVDIYKPVVVTAIITLLLGLMALFYFKSTHSPTKQTQWSDTLDVHWNNPANSLEPLHTAEQSNERFLLIENEGKSQTIPLKDVSHIRVTDHYCTIFYLQDDDWKSWMIMERLKTFEIRYNHLLFKINRSTLINPERIDKIQLLQRKLTMQGEPEFLLTISQSSLETIKSILASNPKE